MLLDEANLSVIEMNSQSLPAWSLRQLMGALCKYLGWNFVQMNSLLPLALVSV